MDMRLPPRNNLPNPAIINGQGLRQQIVRPQTEAPLFKPAPLPSGQLHETTLQWLSQQAFNPYFQAKGANGQPLAPPRWDSRRMPLQIAWKAAGEESDKLNGDIPASLQAEANELLQQALDAWAEASQRQLSFLPGNPAEADILLAWDYATVLGRDNEVGHTNRQLNMADSAESNSKPLIIHAEITLIVSPQIDRKLSPAGRKARLAATLLHEIGHALGVEHSTNPQDVMYYRGWQNTSLSENDGRRLRQLYPLHTGDNVPDDNLNKGS